MKKSDFKEHREIYITNCKIIISQRGICSGNTYEGEKYIWCQNCPFSDLNQAHSVKHNNCYPIYKSIPTTGKEDKKLIAAAKEYLELFNPAIVNTEKSILLKGKRKISRIN